MEENSSELLCVLLQTGKWEPACYQVYQQLQNNTRAYCVPVVLCARPHTAPFYGKMFKFRIIIIALFSLISQSQQVASHGCLQVHPGAMEEKAVGRDAVPPPRALLAVPPALCPAPRSPAHQARQGSQAGI